MRKVALVVLLAACSDDGVRHTPDATTHDGPIADAAPDAPPQPVTLTVTAAGSPAAGVKVYFLNADSSVVLNTTTDSTGTASAVMAAGGSVTAIDPFGSTTGHYTIETFESVKPGDHLRLDEAGASASVTVTVTAPVDGTAGISSYDVQTPCGTGSLTSAGSGAAPSGQLNLSGCGATTDLVIVARDASFHIAEYIYVHNATISNGATLDYSAMTYTASAARSYSFTNIPTGFRPSSYSDGVLVPSGLYLVESNSIPADGSATTINTMGMGTHVSQIAFGGAAGYGQHYFVDWGPWTSSYTTDVGARLLPDLTAFPTFDPTLHAVVVSEATGGAAPDAMYTSVNATRANTTWSWTVEAPHATTIALPTLPTDVFDFTIQSTDSYFINTIGLLKAPGGYDALRPLLLSNYNAATYGAAASGQVTGETILAGFRGPRR